MRTQIKICGIKTAEEVDCINQYPIHYMGLIFAQSRRTVSVETARVLRDRVRSDIEVVGVFVNESAENINAIVKSSNLQVVQLHGEETVGICQQINAKVWKSISVKDAQSLEQIKVYAPYVDGILLDTYSQTEKGGTGKTFDWALIKDLSKTYRIILAGGLSPENIAEAMKTVNPYVLDMNSGVETNFMKDHHKITEVFKRLKEALENE